MKFNWKCFVALLVVAAVFFSLHICLPGMWVPTPEGKDMRGGSEELNFCFYVMMAALLAATFTTGRRISFSG